MSPSEPTPMAHDEAVEIDAVDRYVLGRLPEAERLRFEEHYLSCPACLEQLETTDVLVDGLRHGAAQNAVAVGVSLWATWRRRLLFAAAALVLLVPSLVLYQQLGASRDRLDAALSAPRAGASFLPLAATRDLPSAGAEPSHVVRLEEAWVVLSLELPPPIAERYAVELRDAGGETLWRSDAVAPNAFDALLVELPTRGLEAGTYRLDAVAESGQVTSFSFAAR